MTDDVHTIANALLRHLSGDDSQKEEHFWAWDCVQELIDGGDSGRAWEIIVAALALASTERDVSLIGAGVLESLLHSHGLDLLAAIESEAGGNQNLSSALRFVSTSDADERVRQLVEALLR